MSPRNQEPRKYRITEPDLSNSWVDWLYDNQVGDYIRRGYYVEPCDD